MLIDAVHCVEQSRRVVQIHIRQESALPGRNDHEFAPQQSSASFAQRHTNGIGNKCGEICMRLSRRLLRPQDQFVRQIDGSPHLLELSVKEVC